MENIILGCQYLDGTAVYPPTRSFKQYHDSASSEEASLHDGEEDQTFLEKAETGLKIKRRRLSLRSLRTCCGNVSASVISCIISFFTALLVVIAIFVLSPENPVTVVKERLQMSGSSKPVLLHGASGPSSTHPSTKPAGALQHMHCGSTPQEARALGCIFDVMSFAWTPAACYDGALSQQIQDKTGPWVFYLDHNATMPIGTYDQLTSELVVWTEHSYHVSHCNYAWERIHRAYLDQLLLPAEIAGLNHSLHCMDLLNDMKVKTDKGKRVNAIAYMVFDSCVDLNSGEGEVGDGMMFGHEGHGGHEGH